MADNVTANAGSGGATFATDQDSGTLIHYPWSKIVWGPDDTFNKVDDASGKRFPVLAYLNGVNVSSSGLEVRSVQSGTWTVGGLVSLTGSVQVSIPGVDITLSSLQVVHRGPVSLTGSVQVSIPGVNVTSSALQVAALQSGTWNVAATGLISVTGTVQVAIGTAISVTGTVQVAIGTAISVNSHLVSLTGSVQVSIPGVNISNSSLQVVAGGGFLVSITGTATVAIAGANLSLSSLAVHIPSTATQIGAASITSNCLQVTTPYPGLSKSVSNAGGTVKASAGTLAMIVCTTGGGYELKDGNTSLIRTNALAIGTIHNFYPPGIPCATTISLSCSTGVFLVTYF